MMLVQALAVRGGNPIPFYIALGTAITGAVLLFFARLPLYRQRKFFTVGPKELKGVHWALYYCAYILIVPSVIFLLVVLRVMYAK